jgi:serine/threonine protein phosphatase PrpC
MFETLKSIGLELGSSTKGAGEGNGDAAFSDKELGACIVLDTVGHGKNDEYTAARVAGGQIMGQLKELWIREQRKRLKDMSPEDKIREILLRAHKVLLVNNYRERKGNQDKTANILMTTVALVQCWEDKAGKSMATIGHGGDTRVYILRREEDRLEQLTEDDKDEGSVKNILGTEEFSPNVHSEEVKEGDIIIITTDGVHGVLGNKGIEEIIKTGRENGRTSAEISRALVEETRRRAREERLDDATALAAKVLEKGNK